MELRHDKKLDLAPVLLVLISDELRKVPVIPFQIGAIIFLRVERARKEVVPIVANCKLEDLLLCSPDAFIQLFGMNTADAYLVCFNSRIPYASHPRELDKLAVVDREKGLPVFVFCLFESRTRHPRSMQFRASELPVFSAISRKLLV